MLRNFASPAIGAFAATAVLAGACSRQQSDEAILRLGEILFALRERLKRPASCLITVLILSLGLSAPAMYFRLNSKAPSSVMLNAEAVAAPLHACRRRPG